MRRGWNSEALGLHFDCEAWDDSRTLQGARSWMDLGFAFLVTLGEGFASVKLRLWTWDITAGVCMANGHMWPWCGRRWPWWKKQASWERAT